MLHRKLLDNPIFKNHKLLQVFLYCLLKASHKEHEQLVGDQMVKLKAGDLVTGRKAISAKTGLTEQNVRTALNRLEKLNILTIKSTNKYSVISITKWISHQQSNQQVTNKQPASNQQVTTNNNVKNEKNVNKTTSRFTPPSQIEVEAYFRERGSPLPNQQAETFIDFYSSKGWMVGKNKMKDWKAAVRNWMKRDNQKQSNRTPTLTEAFEDGTLF